MDFGVLPCNVQPQGSPASGVAVTVIRVFGEENRLFSAGDFREIVSARRRGVWASALRGALQLAELPYTMAVRYRNRRYDLGHARTHRVDVPVISVGNLTLGGTGKTPMVEYLATWFRRHGVRVSIISRGYRAAPGELNDEARELSEKLPSVPHLQNPDRVAAARAAIDELETQLILLDDGFQHRRLARDLDLVLVDALDPFGLEHVFPRGMLREPLDSLSRADVIGLSRADLVDAERRELIRDRISRINGQAAWLELAHRPTKLRGRGGDAELEDMGQQAVLAFCGIGNPAGFRRTVELCGATVESFREFPDHHQYTRGDVLSLASWVKEHAPPMVICTHKDLVKIDVDRLGDVPLRALAIELRVVRGQERLDQLLTPLLQRVTDGS